MVDTVARHQPIKWWRVRDPNTERTNLAHEMENDLLKTSSHVRSVKIDQGEHRRVPNESNGTGKNGTFLSTGSL